MALTLSIIHAAEVVELAPAGPEGEKVTLQPGDLVFDMEPADEWEPWSPPAATPTA